MERPRWLLRVSDSGACAGLTGQVLTGGSFQKDQPEAAPAAALTGEAAAPGPGGAGPGAHLESQMLHKIARPVVLLILVPAANINPHPDLDRKEHTAPASRTPHPGPHPHKLKLRLTVPE